MENKKVWVVRGDNCEKHEDVCLRKNWSLIGWHETKNLKGKKEDEITKAVATANEKGLFKSPINEETTSRQLKNFCLDVEEGNIIVFPLKTKPGKIAVGRVKGNYEFRKVKKSDKEKSHTREVVEWIEIDIKCNNPSTLHSRCCSNCCSVRKAQQNGIQQDNAKIGQDILNSIFGNRSTIFQIKRDDVFKRFEKIMNGGKDPYLEPLPDREMDIAIKISPTQFEEVIAQILTELTEKKCTTCLTPPSGDGGVDVIVTKDNKTTFVQVKMTKGKVDFEDEACKLKEAMECFSADYGLIVSWGGFKNDNNEIRKKYPDIELWGRKEFMHYFDKYYHDLPEEIKQKIPPPE